MKKTYKYYLLASCMLVGLFASFTAVGQKNFVEGYIISLEGDTLRGMIDFRNSEKNPSQVIFKRGNQVEKFSPYQIQQFGVNGEIYVSASVEKEVSPDYLGELNALPDVKLEKDTVFLQSLIEGDKSLYFFKSEKRKNNFYIEENGAYTLLLHKRYFKEVNGKKIISHNRSYVSQLSAYLQDCPEINQPLSKTEYSLKSLRKLFETYYACKDEKILFENNIEKIPPEFGVVAGASLTNVSFSSGRGAFTTVVNADYPTSLNFMGGIYFNLIRTKNAGKWSLYNELSVVSYNFEGDYTDFDFTTRDDIFTFTRTELNYTYLKLYTLLRFRYPVNQFALYFNAGISNGYVIASRNYALEDRQLITSLITTEGEAIEGARDYEQGLVVGLGGQFKKFSLEVRYERSNGISPSDGLNSPVDRFQFLLGYRLNR
ncbi:MAG: hypothetical protein ACFB0B_05625 [Thermonemataceae bacterium]